MFGIGTATKIYLAVGATDMRKGFDGLYGGPVVRLTQGLLKLWIDEDEGSWLDWAVPLLIEATRTESPGDALQALKHYMFYVTELDFGEIRARVEKYPSPETAADFMTMADKLRNEGLEKGRDEGREEGALIGQVQILQRLTGRAPEATSELARVPRADLESLIGRLESELTGKG